MAKTDLNCSPWLEKLFEIYSPGVFKNGFALYTMVGGNFETHFSQLAINAFKLSTMVGENFGIYLSQMAKNAFKLSPWLEKILKFTYLKWIKMHLN